MGSHIHAWRGIALGAPVIAGTYDDVSNFCSFVKTELVFLFALPSRSLHPRQGQSYLALYP